MPIYKRRTLNVDGTSWCLGHMHRKEDHEENISAKQIETRQKTRIFKANVHKSGTADYQPAQSQGTEAAFSVTDVTPVRTKPQKGRKRPAKKTSENNQACD